MNDDDDGRDSMSTITLATVEHTDDGDDDISH